LPTNTLVFFLSDNGGPIGGPPKNLVASNGSLRGGKGSVYEGGIRVPFVVRWPARLKPGAYAEPVICLDIFTTAAVAAGASIPRDRPIDGVDLLPHLVGE